METIKLQFRTKNNHLLNEMKKLNMTQKQFAEFLGISIPILSAFVNLDFKRMKEGTTVKIAQMMDLPIHYINPKWAMPFIENVKNSTIDISDDFVERAIENKQTLQIPEYLNDEDLKIEVERCLSTLTKREIEVLKLHLGLDGNKEHTLTEIGKKMDLSRERISQIYEKAIRRLKFAPRSKLLKKFLCNS